MGSRRRLPNLLTAMTATMSLALLAGACGSDSASSTAAGNDDVSTGLTDATTGISPATGPGTTPLTGGTESTPADGGSNEATAAPEALQFQAPLLGGGTFDGTAYGERPVVLWFWAPT